MGDLEYHKAIRSILSRLATGAALTMVDGAASVLGISLLEGKGEVRPDLVTDGGRDARHVAEGNGGTGEDAGCGLLRRVYQVNRQMCSN